MGYFKGLLRNLRNPAVSLLAMIDEKSKVDPKARINRFVKIVNSSVGRYSYVGPGSWIINTEIGSFCSIACDVHIGLAQHTLDFLSTSPIFTERYNGTGHSWTYKDYVKPMQKTRIGNDVWIGEGAKIMPGLTIGNGAVIGTGAIVTHDVEPYAIVAGIPARLIRYRFDKETIESLLKTPWWNFGEEILKLNILQFQTPDIDKDLIASRFTPPDKPKLNRPNELFCVITVSPSEYVCHAVFPAIQIHFCCHPWRQIA